MHTSAKILKWGNSLALRLSGPLKDIPHFEANMEVDIEVTEKGITVTPVTKPKLKLKLFNEADLLDNITAETAHAFELAKLSPKETGD